MAERLATNEARELFDSKKGALWAFDQLLVHGKEESLHREENRLRRPIIRRSVEFDMPLLHSHKDVKLEDHKWADLGLFRKIQVQRKLAVIERHYVPQISASIRLQTKYTYDFQDDKLQIEQGTEGFEYPDIVSPFFAEQPKIFTNVGIDKWPEAEQWDYLAGLLGNMERHFNTSTTN